MTRQQRLLFGAALLLMVVGVSVAVDRHSDDSHVVTGDVRYWNAGDSITVTSQSTDPGGFTVRLRNTHFEGGTERIVAGSNVTIWYRIVGESRPVATKVRVNDTSGAR